MPETFADIARDYKEGADYQIIMRPGLRQEFLIAAIHAGHIQEHAGAIATAVTGYKHGLYLFEGLAEHANEKFYLGSGAYDEPRFDKMANQYQRVVSFHDLKASRGENVLVGGLDEELSKYIRRNLRMLQISSNMYEPGRLAYDPKNVCNRGALRKGVQIEMPRSIRDNEKQLTDVIEVIKSSLTLFQPD